MTGYVLAGALIAMAAWGSAAIFDKLALNAMRGVSPLAAVVVRMIFAVAAVCVVGVFSGVGEDIIAMRPMTFVYLALSALFAAVIGQVTYYYAANAGEVSKVVAFTAGYPLVTVAVAISLLGEPLTWLKVLGTLMTVSGLFVLTAFGSGKQVIKEP
jgi:bacterial/archaeal transporter family protein